MKENKRLKRLLGLLSQKVLTQSDIRSLKTALGRYSNLKSTEFLTMINLCDSFDITQEHSDIGIEYLRKTFFKKNGDPRKAAFDDLTDHDINVLRNFKKFKFIGFHLYHEGFDFQSNVYEIVYRVIAKNGDWFDYLAVLWQSGQFKVLNRGAKND
jgi:hypothetical protein